MGAFEREMESLDQDLENGTIDTKEYNRNIREIENDYRDAARESAQEAYDREMDRW